MKLPEQDQKPRRRLWLLLLLCYPAAAILLLLAECVPGFAEQYARGPYAVYSRAGNLISGLFPFSLAEILLILAAAFAVFWVVKQVVRIVRAKGTRLRETGGSLLRLLCAAGVVLLLFQLNCGVNYSARLLRRNMRPPGAGIQPGGAGNALQLPCGEAEHTASGGGRGYRGRDDALLLLRLARERCGAIV